MIDFATVPSTPDQVAYLDAAAATPAGRDYKQRLLDTLDVRSGQTVLDLGCGPGTDLGRLADKVGDQGSVLGIDRDPVMVEQARRRTAARHNVDVRAGDAHALPLEDDCVAGRARIESSSIWRIRLARWPSCAGQFDPAARWGWRSRLGHASQVLANDTISGTYPQIPL